MSYTLGTIVWYYRDKADDEVSYPGSDPIAATVTEVHGPTSADLTIMLDNDTPIERLLVPLIDGEAPDSGHYARTSRIASVAVLGGGGPGEEGPTK